LPYREPLLVGAETLDKNKRNRIAGKSQLLQRSL
jgi:hypothetical protein